MALDLAAFTRTRPYVYHLTSGANLDSILAGNRIDSAATLIVKDGRTEMLRRRRSTHEIVQVEGRDVWLRDQAPLHAGNLALSGGWSFGDLLEALNTRVFFWPGTEVGPSDYGRRHFGRYVGEAPVLIRVKTAALIAENRDSAAEFCRYNSGSPRYSSGQPSPRGPDTFAAAARFDWSPKHVVEVVFRGAVRLPASLELGADPDGPWHVASTVGNVPPNTAIEPSAPSR
jgi:hypothetical protein